MSGTQPKRGQNGGGSKPVTSKTRRRVIELALQGLSQRVVAEMCGISRTTVAKIAREHQPPIKWDHSATAAATQARTVDLKAARAEISQRAVEQVRSMFTSMTSAHEVTHWDKDGFMHRAFIDQPTTADLRNYATAIGILIDKHLVLVRHDSTGANVSDLDAFLGSLMPGDAA